MKHGALHLKIWEWQAGLLTKTLKIMHIWAYRPRMAIEGDRGGFITLGFDGGYKYQLTSNAFIDLGSYIGAGGGRGGYFLSGGGLMLRPHISFLWSSSYGLDLGAGISYVVFPSDGSIESIQPFIQLSLPYEHERKKIDRNIQIIRF